MAEGIMSLPNSPENLEDMAAPPVPEVSPEDLKKFEDAGRQYANQNPVAFGEDLLSAIGEADPSVVEEFVQVLSGADIPDELLDAMGQMVDAIVSEPENYEENRLGFIQEGVPEDLLPEQYDPAYFAALNIALDKISAQKSSRPEIPEEMQFAEGGLATLADYGRNGDTMLAHITPHEARMLRRRGGSGTINPVTGLPEFGFFKSLFKAVGKVFKAAVNVVTAVVKPVINVVKKVAQNPIGRVVLTVGATMLLGPGGPLFSGAGLAGGISSTIASMPTVALALNTAAAGTLVNLASGQKFGDALKGGLLAGALAGVGGKIFGTPQSYQDAAAAASSKGVAATGAAKTAGLGESYSGEMPKATPIDASNAQAGIPSSEAATSASKIAEGAGSATTATKVAEQSWLGKTFGKPGEWIDENIMPSGIKASARPAQEAAYRKSMAALGNEEIAKQAFDEAGPGLLRTYGPIAAVGAGAAYLAGAFDPPAQEEVPAGFEGMVDERYAGKTGYQLLEESPEKWGFDLGKVQTTVPGIDPYIGMYGSSRERPGAASLLTYAAHGGEMRPRDFPRKTGPIDGPGTGTSDSIPAMLSDGEFVMTARAVRGAGGGSRREGAKRMYALMKSLEKSHGG